MWRGKKDLIACLGYEGLKEGYCGYLKEESDSMACGIVGLNGV